MLMIACGIILAVIILAAIPFILAAAIGLGRLLLPLALIGILLAAFSQSSPPPAPAVTPAQALAQAQAEAIERARAAAHAATP